MAITRATSNVIAQNAAMQNIADGTCGGLSFRNKIINGDMRIDQRRSNTPDTTGNAYVADRWACFSTLTNTFTIQCLSADGPAGFTSSARVLLNSTRAPGASDIYGIVQKIETQNLYSLQYGTAAAKPVTISFWVKSSVTGTYGARIAYSPTLSPFAATYAYTYNINQANTWEYKTITIPGNTTFRLVDNPVGVGLDVLWNLGSGSSRSTSTPNQWLSNDFHTVNETVSFVTRSPGATWQITGVQLEEGPVATPFEQRPIGIELALCQRYYEKSYAMDVAPRTITNGGAVIQRFGYVDSVNGEYYTVTFKTEKRTSSPAISLISRTNGALGFWTDGSSVGLPNITAQVSPTSFTNSKSFSVNIRFISSAFTSVEGHWTADAEL